MQRAGDDPQGLGVQAEVETARSILRDAQHLLDRAENALTNKARDMDSLNVFLIVHPFDRFALETTESPVIARALPALPVSNLDTVWVLWVPDHLTMWSQVVHSWTDLFFNTGSMEEAPLLSVLQDAESDFLSGISYRNGSPYLFGLTGDATS